MDDDFRILVFGEEDSPEDLIEYELSKSNLRCTALRVSSRGAFLQSLQEFSPNLILVTIGNAEIGGLTAVALAQEFCPGTPCFLINDTGRVKRPPAEPKCQDNPSSRDITSFPLQASITNFFAATGLAPMVWDKPGVSLIPHIAFQPFLQISRIIIAFLSREGRVLEFNQGTERLTGWRREEILGQDGVEVFFPKSHRASAWAHLQRVLSGKSGETIDLPLKVRRGQALSYRWHCNLVSDGLGQPAGIMLVGQLLSESKLWEDLPRARMARSCPSPAISQGRGLLTRRTGTC